MSLLNKKGQEMVQNIIDAVKRERDYQTQKHGSLQERPKAHSGWYLIISHEFNEALNAWNKSHDDDNCLCEILQVLATTCAAVEQVCLDYRQWGHAYGSLLTLTLNDLDRPGYEWEYTANVLKKGVEAHFNSAISRGRPLSDELVRLEGEIWELRSALATANYHMQVDHEAVLLAYYTIIGRCALILLGWGIVERPINQRG